MTYAAFLSTPSFSRALVHDAPRQVALNLAAESSSFLDASAATTALVNSLATNVNTQVAVPAKEFEPILPDTTALASIGVVLLLSAAAGWVWANQVVPTSRTKLALSKRQGGVKEYLDELDEAGADDRPLEQWLFTDWLEGRNATAVGGRQKEPALPILKKAKWNSGDNPILAATALIMVGVIFTSITERIFS